MDKITTTTYTIRQPIADIIRRHAGAWTGLDWETDLAVAFVGDEKPDGTRWTEEALEAARAEEREAIAADAQEWQHCMREAAEHAEAGRWGRVADCLHEADARERTYGDPPATRRAVDDVAAVVADWLVRRGVPRDDAEEAVADLGKALRDLQEGAGALVDLVEDDDLEGGWDSAADAARVVAAGEEDDEAAATWPIYCAAKASGVQARGPIAEAAKIEWCRRRAQATRNLAARNLAARA